MSILKELEIKPIINAWGTVTKIGGSTMDKSVIEAMQEVSQSYLSISKLQENAGDHIARLIGVEGAFITSGAAAAITLSTAVCITGSDIEAIYKLPDTTNLKDEVMILKSHRFRYDQGVKIAGGKIIEVGLSDLTLEEQIFKAINEKTAMFLFLAESENLRGSLPLTTVSKILKKFKIPLVVDAAAELPPVENFKRFINDGADLVIFSGGKDIRGPQSSGLILGKKNLTRLCLMNSTPNHGVCRGMKVDKETIVGLTKAIENYLKKDWKKEYLRYRELNDLFCDNLKKFTEILFMRGYPTEPGIQPASIERVYFQIKKNNSGISTSELKHKLQNCNHNIYFGEYHDDIVFNPQMLSYNEVEIINSEIDKIWNDFSTSMNSPTNGTDR